MKDRVALDALLEHEDWAAHTRLMTGYAYKLLWRSSWDTAEDIARQARLRFYEGAWKRWKPGARTLRAFLLGLVYDEHSNWRKKKSTTAERLQPPDVRDDKKPHEQQPRPLPEHPTAEDDSPEAEAARREKARLVRQRFETRIEDDEPVKRIYAMFDAGIDEPAAQAEHANMDIEEVRNARKRLFRHLEAIERELEPEEDEARR